MMHHIVFDGWSEAILLAELGALSAAVSEGKPSPLPEPNLQYSDFAAWQQQRIGDEHLAEHLSYWRQQLRDLPSTLALPTDFARATASRSRGGSAPRVKRIHDRRSAARRGSVAAALAVAAVTAMNTAIPATPITASA